MLWHQRPQIRIGNRSIASSFVSLLVSTPDDGLSFQNIVNNTVKNNPDDPLIIAVNHHCVFLEHILATCINFHATSPATVNREVQFSQSVQLPQTADRRAAQIPWTFIVDHMNLPEIWHWTFGRNPPPGPYTSKIDEYRFKIGAWVCDQGAYIPNIRTPVVILFTRPDYVSEDIISSMVFPFIFHAARTYDDPAADDASNLIAEVGRKLNQAELDSHRRDLPVKVRTKILHKEVDRIYELLDFLRFHTRSFNKLAKFKNKAVNTGPTNQSIWEVMDDCIEDLSQYENYLDSMKERFNNLIELDFNIENATQSSDARFISILGAVFLPISFLASLFSINTVEWTIQHYITFSVPLFAISVILVFTLPVFLNWKDHQAHPAHIKRITLRSGDFTLLGEEAPAGEEPLSYQPLRTNSSSPDKAFPKNVDKHLLQSSPQGTPKLVEPPRGRKRSSTISYYGIHRSPGVVGSRRKNLHEENSKRGRMYMTEADREADREVNKETDEDIGTAPDGYGPNLHPAHIGDREFQWPMKERSDGAAEAREERQDREEREERGDVDGCDDPVLVVTHGATFHNQDDIEKLGSRRRLQPVHASAF